MTLKLHQPNASFLYHDLIQTMLLFFENVLWQSCCGCSILCDWLEHYPSPTQSMRLWQISLLFWKQFVMASMILTNIREAFPPAVLFWVIKYWTIALLFLSWCWRQDVVVSIVGWDVATQSNVTWDWMPSIVGELY